MKLIETYKNEPEDGVFIFNYLGDGFNGYLYSKNMELIQYISDPYLPRDCVYRITQTQGNSVA